MDPTKGMQPLSISLNPDSSINWAIKKIKTGKIKPGLQTGKHYNYFYLGTGSTDLTSLFIC